MVKDTHGGSLFLNTNCEYRVYKVISVFRSFECQKTIFSVLRPESTYFPDAARPAKTYFLATVAEKFFTILGHKQRMTQIAVYHPRLRLGR